MAISANANSAYGQISENSTFGGLIAGAAGWMTDWFIRETPGGLRVPGCGVRAMDRSVLTSRRGAETAASRQAGALVGLLRSQWRDRAGLPPASFESIARVPGNLPRGPAACQAG